VIAIRHGTRTRRLEDMRIGNSFARALTIGMLATSLAAGSATAGRKVDTRAAGVGAGGDRITQILRDHPLRTLDGRTVSVPALRGQVVVINFWASWCAPCRHELPRLDALNADVARNGGRVLAVSIDLEARNADRFAKKLGLKLPICHDGPDGLAKLLDLQHIPFTLVLDRSGDVVFTTSGSDDASLSALESAARQAVASRPVATRESDSEEKP
jgi:thiol-disulfide isomerase/thioredoxin